MSRAYEVTSYFLIDGVAVAVDDFHGRLRDEYYIIGWIELFINSQQVLGRAHCDLVDQLWAYMIDGMTQLDRGVDVWDTFFPDQPLKLSFNRVGESNLLITIGELKHSVSYHSFLLAIAHGGNQFFEKMNQILPQSTDVWTDYLQKCKLLSDG